MADTVTDKDVEQARKRVDRLHEQIAEEQAKLYDNARNAENTVRVAQLETEEDRLKRELDALRGQNKATTQRSAVRNVIEDVRAGSGEGEPADIVVEAESVGEATESKER